MPKLPSIQFYPGDWLRDPVSGLSLSAQGLWLRMLLISHDSPRYGYLCYPNGTPLPPEIIASKCGCSLEQYETLLAELDSVNVPSRTPSGTIYSRRMMRDERRRAQYRKSKANNQIEVIPHQFHTNSTPSSSSTSKIKTSPLPPAAAGDSIFRFDRYGEVIVVEMGKKKRLLSQRDWESLSGQRADGVVRKLQQRGFKAWVEQPTLLGAN